MTKFIDKSLRSPGKFLLFLVVINLVFWGIGWFSCLDRNSWPSWIQGVGSVEAILVAVWVTWNQAEMQRLQSEKIAKDELRGLLRSFRTEIEISLENVNRGIGPILDGSIPGEGFYTLLPVPEDPFVIYNGLIPKLGLIEQDPMCYHIVRAYSAAKSFVLTIRYNNELLQALAEEKRGFSEPNVISAKRSIDEYGDAVRASWATVKLEVDLALHLLNRI